MQTSAHFGEGAQVWKYEEWTTIKYVLQTWSLWKSANVKREPKEYRSLILHLSVPSHVGATWNMWKKWSSHFFMTEHFLARTFF